MNSMHYVGLDVHKKTISFCEKTVGGRVVDRGTVASTREGLGAWAAARRRPWHGALEATLFSGWVYDFLTPRALSLQVAHPAMLKAISCGIPPSAQATVTEFAFTSVTTISGPPLFNLTGSPIWSLSRVPGVSEASATNARLACENVPFFSIG